VHRQLRGRGEQSSLASIQIIFSRFTEMLFGQGKIDKKALLYDSPHLAPVVVDTRGQCYKTFYRGNIQLSICFKHYHGNDCRLAVSCNGKKFHNIGPW